MKDMLTKPEKTVKLKEWLTKTRLDKDIVARNIGTNSECISPQVLLDASKKLVKINRKEEEPDDRDNLRFSRFLGLEDYIEENIMRDSGRLQMKAAGKMQSKKNLSWLTPGFFTSQVRSTIIGNSLTQNVDGINPMEHYDNSNRVTKLGPGGIPSEDAIPVESRQVNVSSFGFMDPVHVMESSKIGVSSFMNHNVVKGRDGKLYRIMKDQDGKLKWMDHEDILNHQVLIPDVKLPQ